MYVVSSERIEVAGSRGQAPARYREIGDHFVMKVLSLKLYAMIQDKGQTVMRDPRLLCQLFQHVLFKRFLCILLHSTSAYNCWMHRLPHVYI